MTATENKASIKGGEFLIKEVEAHQIFIPEEFTEEQQMIAETCRDFLKTEVHPRLNEIDTAKSPELMSSLIPCKNILYAPDPYFPLDASCCS